MGFKRITVRVLPDGELATVRPFHVSTEGQEDRVIFRDDEDLKVGFNYFPICAHRANVRIVTCIDINTHVHAMVLAREYDDVDSFINMYKISVSKYLTNKYGTSGYSCIYRNVDATPILLEDNQHVRNTLCYIAKNSLDLGIRVDRYRWSAYRAMFSHGAIDVPVKKCSDMSYRQVRNVLRTDSIPHNVEWMITEDGVLEPSSFCDWQYVEEAFNGDASFFLRTLGLTDNNQMDQEMVINPKRRLAIDELLKIIDEKCIKWYGRSLAYLDIAEKIPVIKSIYYSTNTHPAQLARCFGLAKEQIIKFIGKRSLPPVP